MHKGGKSRMRKSFIMCLALVLTFFTMPFGGMTTMADEKAYSNIADGEYDIEIEALEENSDEKSAADGFLLNKAELSVQGEDTLLTIKYTKDFPQDYGVNWSKLEGNEPLEKDENDTEFIYTFQVDEITEVYQAAMNYYVPDMPGDMGDKDKGHSADYKIVLDKDELSNLPQKSDDEEASEERKEGQLLTEEEADAVYQLNYKPDSKATEAQLENPVKLLEKDNKEYVQIQVNDEGAQFFRSLKINEKEVTWNSITEGPYSIQFELPNGIEDELELSMVIQAGPNVMPHDDIKLWFDEESLETIKEPEPESPEESELDPENLDEGVYTLDYTFLEKGTDNASAMDEFTEGPAYVKINKDDKQFVAMTLTNANWIKGFKVNNKSVKVLQENEEENTRVVGFPIENLLEKQVGSVSVDVPGVYKTTHDVDLVFDVDSLKSAKDNDYPEDQNVEQSEPDEPDNDSDNPKDNDDPEEEEKPTKEPVTPTTQDEKYELVPEKAYAIDYVVKHETEDRASAADNFFKKPGHLLYLDDEKFIQLKINNWAMIDWLRTEHGGDVIVVKENDDGSALIQFKVEGELSEVINLSMSVTVPNVYEDKVHEARLI